MIINLSEQASLLHQFMGELRDINIQKDRMRFRRNMERIGEIMAYEISRTLAYTDEEVETPLGIANIKKHTQGIVLGTILRAGLPLHQGLLNYFDEAENAFISAYRRHHKDGTFEVNVEYVSCPDLTDSVLIIADPMLATGASMDIVIKTLADYGEPAELHIVTAVASAYGLDFIRRKYPDAHIWIGALDEELTARSYIVPGLGDAGDLSYGAKVQE